VNPEENQSEIQNQSEIPIALPCGETHNFSDSRIS